MTPDEKSLLERTYKLAEENNNILRSIRRSNRISTILRVVYWVIIVGLAFGSYYLIQPYLSSLLGVYDQVNGSLKGDYSAAQNAADTFKNLFQ